jgi:hypothetical protein
MDQLEGTWNIQLCAGPSGIEELLEGAKVTITPDEATWTLEGVDVKGKTTPKGGKLWGEISFKGESYYYEIGARTPPPPITAKPCTYGIFSQLHPDQRGGGDLGDPGIWTAEESGTTSGTDSVG